MTYQNMTNGEIEWEIAIRLHLTKNKIKNWATDLRRSFDLIDQSKVSFGLNTLGRLRWCAILYDDEIDVISAVTDSPARAICEAWLQWSDLRHE